MNKTVKNENEITVIKSKSVAKKPTKNTTNTTAVAVVNNTDFTNKSVKSKLLTFDETMSLMTECGIGSKSKTKNYRILNGGSSIHVLKTMYRIYMTSIDFELVSQIANCNDLQLLKNDNAVDSKRPHTIICITTDTLKKVFGALKKNALNAPC